MSRLLKEFLARRRERAGCSAPPGGPEPAPAPALPPAEPAPEPGPAAAEAALAQALEAGRRAMREALEAGREEPAPEPGGFVLAKREFGGFEQVWDLTDAQAARMEAIFQEKGPVLVRTRRGWYSAGEWLERMELIGGGKIERAFKPVAGQD